MKGELSTMQQQLMPEAAAVLQRSIAEAARRSHAQTTPLHVASTLLASSSSLLRQACLRSHPTTANPLHTRALDLCFSVALDRLPTSTSVEPALSNALVAALKRAQAHQRRACPEQQQQPILAVKVELNELIISILDDPSVSRVMHEASFSSPAIKAAIEKSLPSPSPSPTSPLPRTNLYINPRLNTTGGSRQEEVKRVLEILSRSKKRNPILVGDPNPEVVMQEVLQKIGEREHTQIITLSKEFSSIDRSRIPSIIKELSNLLTTQNGANVLDIGNLKWLVESPGAPESNTVACPTQQQATAETGRAAVGEMGRLLARFRESSSRLWIVGTATCETYLRCQVYHPTMETEWDLQALPIAPTSPLSRNGGAGVLISSAESLAFPLRSPKTQPKNSVNANLLIPQSMQPKSWIDQEISPVSQPEFLASPVSTDLALGRPNKPPERSQLNVDSNSLKSLYHGLTSKVKWQPEAAAAVAVAIMQRKSGTSKLGSDSWLLFTGPDRAGKRRMAAALSELMYGTAPITISFGCESNVSVRGKTSLDCAADAIRHNQFSVIVLEDIDNAEMVILSTVKRAMKDGRMSDSSGREVSLGSVIFVLTANCIPNHLEQKCSKLRRTNERNGAVLSLDLRLRVAGDDDGGEDSSDLTVEDEQRLYVGGTSMLSEIVESVNETVVFKPV